jgi:hypothetical protein
MSMTASYPPFSPVALTTGRSKKGVMPDTTLGESEHFRSEAMLARDFLSTVRHRQDNPSGAKQRRGGQTRGWGGRGGKSKAGTATPKLEMDLIRQRLKQLRGEVD